MEELIVKVLKSLIRNWEKITAFVVMLWGTFFTCRKIYFYVKKKWVVPITSMWKKIHYEFNDNGGGSMKDKLNLGVKLVAEIDIKVDGIIGRQRALFNEGLTAMYINNEKGVCQEVNKAWVRLTGLPKDLAIGHGWERIVHENDLKRLEEEGQDFINDGESYDGYFRVTHYVSKETFRVHCTASKVRDNKGVLISVIGTLERL